MRVAILSDVHGNAAAVEAVLADISDCDAIWNLGDTVGYGPEPVRCMELLAAAEPAVTLVGNHDLACIGRLDTSDFNLVARQATDWTAMQLGATHREALAGLPQTTVVGEATLVHGSPRSPVWEYVISAAVAAENMGAFTTRLCFVGHTHVAAIASCPGDSGTVRFQRQAGGTVANVGRERAIINPGSVGQPRDGDPRAGYIVFDAERATVEFRRVAYPVARTQEAIARAGLPEILGLRLALGR